MSVRAGVQNLLSVSTTQEIKSFPVCPNGDSLHLAEWVAGNQSPFHCGPEILSSPAALSADCVFRQRFFHVQPEFFGVTLGYFFHRLLCPEETHEVPPTVEQIDSGLRFDIGPLFQVLVDERGELHLLDRRPLGQQPDGRKFVVQRRIQPAHPLSRFTIHADLRDQACVQRFHARFYFARNSRRHFAESNRPPLAVTRNELNRTVAFSIA